MRCKEAQRLAFKWYGSKDVADKQAYLEHRRTCTFCRLEFIRNNKEMEQDIDTYQYNDSVLGDEVTA